MLELLIASLPSLLPQDPPAVTPAPAVTTASAATPSPARWLPETTLAALVVGPMPGDSPAAALWTGPDGAAFRDLAARLLQPGLSQLHLSLDDLGASLQGGFAVAFVGFTAGHQPDVVFIADLGARITAINKVLAPLPTNDTLHVLVAGPQAVLATTREGMVAIGTDAATIQATLARALEPSGPSLADEVDFQRSHGPASGQTLAHVFIRLGDLTAALLETLPREVTTAARRTIDVLGVDDMHWASAVWQLTGDELVTRWQIEAPRAEGLFDALAGTVGRLDPSLARFVPTGSNSYGFFTLQFGTVFDELLALANAVQPVAAKMVTTQLDQFSSRAGIDVRADLVGGLAGRLVTFTASTDTPQAGVLLELRQGPAYARALGKLLEALPVSLTQGTSSGVPCWRVDRTNQGIAPAFAVVGNWLAIGSSDEALNLAVRQVQEPRAAPEVLALLRALPSDATGAVVAPLSTMVSTWLTQMPVPKDDFGTRNLILRRTADAFVAEEHTSATGTLRSASGTMTALMTPPGAPADVPTPHLAAGGDAAAATTLRDAEAEGSTRSNITAVTALLAHGNPDIVARACWLLGEWKALDAIVVLGDVAHDHATASVRLQATAALAHMANSATAQGLTRAVQDPDGRVRLCAIQALGRLGAPIATAPAMTLIDHLGSKQPTETPNDLVAALVVLHDVGDPANLMPAATAIGFAHPQVGQALTFLFQGLSPRQQPKEEVTTLLAVLDHPEPMLRRYAIQRLGELRDPTTAKALEVRLAAEAADLQPLIRVSLTQVRGDVGHEDDDLVARAKNNVAAISQMVERRWKSLGSTGQIATGATVGIVVLAVIGFLVARRRTRQSAAVAEAQSLVEPSASYAASGRGSRYQSNDQLPVGDDESVGVAPGDEEQLRF